jgi:polar amino acid transport system ATP-binding protein
VIEDKMINPILRVEDIHKSYGQNKVLRGVSFEMFQGKTKVIIGPSGTGKSTLLRCVNQLVIPDQGKIWLDGSEVNANNKNIDNLRSSIGMVFQDFNLFTHLTALDNVKIGLLTVKGLTKSEATEKALQELRRVGLADKSSNFPSELSGGQQQRVSIARALSMSPKLILFDEPTSALDPELISEVLEVMIKLAKEGMTMLVVSHEMGFARTVSDEIIFMENGMIVEQGSPKKLFENPVHKRTKEFFNKITELYGDHKK